MYYNIYVFINIINTCVKSMIVTGYVNYNCVCNYTQGIKINKLMC